MSEEEKEAIEYLNKYIKSDLFYEQEHYNRIEIVLNLIDKLQKELQYVSDKQVTIEEVIRNFKRINIEYDYLILVKNGIVIGVI